jgi:hypothetical protein
MNMSERHRERDRDPAPRPGRRRSITAVRGDQLPTWVRDEIVRSTTKPRRDAALQLLRDGIAAYADGRFRAALRPLREAKELSPRAATIRELLGLSAYQAEVWEEGLRELRTFRRITGETIHMPVEMDCQRALGRPADVARTWELFQELGGDRDTDDEARVVYASHLLDESRPRDAWEVVKPGRLVANAASGVHRRWFVAARAALACGDRETAARLERAIREQDPDLPGLADLASQVRSAH